MSAEDLFAGHPAGLAIHDRVAEVVGALGAVESRVTRSQVASQHGRGFAFVSMHHLELDDPDQVEHEVCRWLREAWEHAAR